MVLLAGGVAALGDVIGRRIGKKRLRIGRMRPKHTAILFTFLAGALGTLLVVLIIAALSEPVRTWIAEGNRARSELIETQGELEEASDARDDLEAKNTLAEQELEATQGEINLLTDQLGEKEIELGNLRGEAGKLGAEIGKLRLDTKRLGDQLNQTKSTLTDAQASLAAAKGEIEAVEINRNRFIKENELINKRNLQLTAANANLENTLDELGDDIAELERQKTAVEKQLDEAAERYRIEIDAERKKLDDVRSDLDTARGDLSTAQGQLADVQRRLNAAQQQARENVVAARTTALLINRGDELHRTGFDRNLNQSEARRLVDTALRQAELQARLRGVTPIAGERAAQFIELPEATPEQQRQALIDAIEGRVRPGMLIVNALLNTFAGDDTAALNAAILDNPIIYRQGEVILETQLDGTKTEAEIAQEAAGILQQQLPPRLIEDGMVPAQGREAMFGELDSETLLNLVREVKEADARVPVRFIAREQTRAGDPLSLGYRIG